jgi:voltage-gated sodium channel
VSLSRNTPPRERVGAWVESNRIQSLIVALILLNAATLGLETSVVAMERFGELLYLLDRTILTVFVIEIGLKLYAQRLGFFRAPWNVFDFLVVGIALIPASGPLAVLRALRVLRVLRLVSMTPRLRFVVEALLRAVPGISSIGLLLLILFYVFGVMATGLFGGRFPQWFGTVADSMYTLFQIMTLESWSMGIVRPLMEEYTYAWVFFIPFILIATFTMLNLFIGIIVDTMQSMHSAEHGKDRDHIEEVVHEDTSSIELEVRALREEIRALRRVLPNADSRQKET